MKQRWIYVISCATAWMPLHSHAYEVQTHEEVLTRAAVDRSCLVTDPTVLRDLGLEKGVTDEAQRFPDSNNELRPIRRLIEVGSRFEDNVSVFSTSPEVRVTKHFYNPRTGQGLNVPFSPLPIQTSSPDWALAPVGSNPDQQYSYWNARRHLFDALTLSGEADRSRAFGLAFQTLGQVAHLLQDMAQPQHVRNDVHCDTAWCALLNIPTTPSLYEKWTDSREVRGALPVDPGSGGQAQGYDAESIVRPPFASTFNSPRRFWHTEPWGANSVNAGRGVAEFTHRNFVSAGSNFFRTDAGGFIPHPDFPLPAPGPVTEKRQIADPDMLGSNQPLRGEIWFIGSEVTDTLTGQSNFNPRASSYSVFAADLRGRSGLPTVTLNRFNFDSAHEYLIPRAVGYSAGLINYFFRGRLDFKRDDQDPTKFRIVNLSNEAMNGRFALYYDAQDGRRYPVPVDPADPNRDPNDPNAWRLTIAAPDPTQPNANLSEPVAFIMPPNDGSPLSPKEADEYMLVFSGDMGEERAATGAIGAVAAKAIATPYNGALYLLGLNSAGQRVSLRADKTGTRILGPGEFDPLRGVTIPSSYQSLPKAYVTKQVAFTEHPGGYSYGVLAATVGIHYPYYGAFATGWVKNLDTNAFEIVSGVVWTAKSDRPEIGTFRFRPIINESTPSSGLLEYRRTYADATGNRRSVTGTIPLPALPGNQNYLVFPQGLVFVSGDGLAISGFQRIVEVLGNPYSATMEDYELRISLAEVPSLAFVKTGQHLYFESTGASIPFSREVTGTVSATAPCDSPPTTTTGDITSTVFLRERTTNLDEILPIEYINGALRTYRRTEQGHEIVSQKTTEAFVVVGIRCRWIYAMSKGETIDKLSADGGYLFGNGALIKEIRGDRVFNPPFPNLYPPNLTWDYFYEGLAPEPPIQYTPLPAPVSTRDYYVDRALTDRVEDAVYTLFSGTSPSVTLFRSHDITGKWHVSDASPLGEVFFATSDLSLVVHEPKRGPKVVIPPNVVRLLAAVWL